MPAVPVNLYAASPVLTVTAVPRVTESPVVAEPETPVVKLVYASIAVPTVTESPVPKLPSVIVNVPLLYAAVAPEAEVTTVFFVIFGIEVFEPPVTTVLKVAPVTTVLAVTGFKVLFVVPAV